MTIKKVIKISVIIVLSFITLVIGLVFYTKYIATIKYEEKLTVLVSYEYCTCDEFSFYFTIDSIDNSNFNYFVGKSIRPYSKTFDLEKFFYKNYIDTSKVLNVKVKLTGKLHKNKEYPFSFPNSLLNVYKFETEKIE